MNRVHIINYCKGLFLLSSFILGTATAQSQSTIEGACKIEMSNNYINDLMRYNAPEDPSTLIYPLVTLTGHNQGSLLQKEWQYMEIYQKNLDEDSDKELIGLFGKNFTEVVMGVFKKIHGKWYLIYCNDFANKLSGCWVQVAEGVGKNPPFIISHLEWQDDTKGYKVGYYFFRLMDDKVTPALRLMGNAIYNDPASAVWQDVSCRFQFPTGSTDYVRVIYRFKYSIEQGGLKLAEGERSTNYHWSGSLGRYTPILTGNNAGETHLDEASLTAFEQMPPTANSIKNAFGYELQRAAQESSSDNMAKIQQFIQKSN